MWWRRLAEVQTEHQNGEERGFKWLWTWNGCWSKLHLVISKTADILGFSRTTISRVYRERSEKEKICSEWQLCGRKCLVEVRGQRRMGRLVRDDRKVTVTQITTRYNQGMQNTIPEHTTRQTLKQMGSSSRRPHRVPLLSAKNRKRRQQFTQTHQDWTIRLEKRCLVWRVRIWRKEHESMDPSCLFSTVQAAGVMVWWIFSWHTLAKSCLIWESGI